MKPRMEKVLGRDEAKGEMKKSEDKLVIDWICKLCNVTF